MARVFFLHPGEWPLTDDAADYSDGSHLPSGWYWQTCSCTSEEFSDGDPIGPFPTEAEALADAREGYESL